MILCTGHLGWTPLAVLPGFSGLAHSIRCSRLTDAWDGCGLLTQLLIPKEASSSLLTWFPNDSCEPPCASTLQVSCCMCASVPLTKAGHRTKCYWGESKEIVTLFCKSTMVFTGHSKFSCHCGIRLEVQDYYGSQVQLQTRGFR